MVKLLVNRKRLFSFPRKIEADYGRFGIREQHEISAKVLGFTTNDLMFFEPLSNEFIKASEFQKMVLDEGFVPLDIYAAQALYENKESLWELHNLWSHFTVHADRSCQLDNILFLGSIVARNDKDVDHFSAFKYTFMSSDIDFMPFEDDPFFQKDRDFILVYKKEFIKKL